MNLMARNDGAYLSPDFSDLGDRARAEIKALVLDQARRSPGAAIFVACGSQGGAICWKLLRDSRRDAVPRRRAPARLQPRRRLPQVARRQGRPRSAFRSTSATAPRTSVFDWHERGGVLPQGPKAAAPTTRSSFALFDTGSHGTPIRMTDWRLVLNWMWRRTGCNAERPFGGQKPCFSNPSPL